METRNVSIKNQNDKKLLRRLIKRMKIREKAQKILDFSPPSQFTSKLKLHSKLLPIKNPQNTNSLKLLPKSTTPNPRPLIPLPSFLQGKQYPKFLSPSGQNCASQLCIQSKSPIPLNLTLNAIP